ncbi:MAG: type II toxin-antitoxin system Phd/YefM family antitoxin [Chloroflexota bacterium]
MTPALPVVPVSDLRYKAKEVLAEVAKRPVVITQRGRATAVVLNLEAYNQMVCHLESLEAIKDEALLLIAQEHLDQMKFVGAEALVDLYERKTGERPTTLIPA